MKDLKLIFASLLVGAFFVLSFDYFFSIRFIPLHNGVWDESVLPYKSGEHGWYDLKKSFAGKGHWGGQVYDVNTDDYGFRSKEHGGRKQADYFFLGDSFTFGVNGPWSETFVGMLANHLQNDVVINAGVPSYSPTPYLHQLQRAVSAGAIKEGTIVILGLDISDVQDEAACWTDGENHPIKIRGGCYVEDEKPQPEFKLLKHIENRLRFTGTIARWLDMQIRPELYETSVHRDTFDTSRSAFTWHDWDVLNAKQFPSGYLPLGVEGGLQRIEVKLSQIKAIVEKSRAQLFVLIYPWPAQFTHESHFSYREWVRSVCTKLTCDGVIDTYDGFLRYKLENWYDKFFLRGDIHFNVEGNKIIFEEILRTLNILNVGTTISANQ